MGKIKRSLLLIGLLALASSFLCFSVYFYAKRHLIQQAEISLRATTTQVTASLNDYIQRAQTNELAFLQLPEMQQAIVALQNPEQSQQATQQISGLLTFHQRRLSLRRLVFASAQGEILYTSDGAQIGLNLFKDSFDHPEMASSLIRTIYSWAVDLSQFVFETQTGTPELYLSIPVEKDKKYLGAFSMSLSPKAVNDLVLAPEIFRKNQEVTLFALQEQRIVLLTPSIHNAQQPFRVWRPYAPFAKDPLNEAINGETNHGIALSLTGQKVIADWSFIPRLNWGILTQTNYAATLKNIASLWKGALVFFFGGVALLLYFWLQHGTQRELLWRSIKEKWSLWKGRASTSLLSLLCFCAIISLSLSIYHFYDYRHQSLLKVQGEVREKMREAVFNAQKEPSQIVSIIDWTAADLQAGRLRQEDLAVRLTRDLSESPELQRAYIAYAPNPNPFALVAERKGQQIEVAPLPPSYEYTHPAFFNSTSLDWYALGMTGGKQWLLPYQDPTSNHLFSLYIAPFTHAADKGVIAGFYDLSPIIAQTQTLAVNSIGNGFLFSKDGTLLSATDNVRPLLSPEALQHQKEDVFVQLTPSTYLFTKQIPGTPWLIGFLFDRSDVPTDFYLVRNALFSIISFSLLLILAIAALFCKLYFSPLIQKIAFPIVYTVLVIFGLATLLATVYTISESPEIPGLVINDKTALDNFIHQTKADAADQFLPAPTLIPTGMWLQFIDLLSDDRIPFSGFVWQKYPSMTSSTEGVFIPQATSLNLEKVFSHESAAEKTIDWRLMGTLVQKNNQKDFPFDRFLIRFNLASKDIDSNLYLIPDLNSYHQYTPTSAPGLSPEVTLPGFQIAQTFFSLEPKFIGTDFGKPSQGGATRQTSLYFNIYLVRQFLQPFVTFFIPMLVIQIGLFSIFLLTKKDEGINFMSSISAYTGGFFVLSLLEITLRNQHESDSLLYGETFCLVAYFMIFLLYLHVIWQKYSPQDQEIKAKVHFLLNRLFWPFQVTLWYGIAFFFFYHPTNIGY